MPFNINNKNEAGFSLVEVLLAAALFALVAGVFVGAIIYAEQTSVTSGRHARAVLYAEAGMEALRSIRDQGFNSLTDGTYGLSSQNGSWQLTNSADTFDVFSRQVLIASSSTSTKDVFVTVTWQKDLQRTSFITLSGKLTNWKGN